MVAVCKPVISQSVDALLRYVRQFFHDLCSYAYTRVGACVRVHVLLNHCACVCLCACVVCITVPIVRWRSVRCAAVRRPLSSSLLALWQASRQLPEMQDSVLGKKILVLFPLPTPLLLCPTSTTHPPLCPAITKCSKSAMREGTDIFCSSSCYLYIYTLSLLAWPPSHTNPEVMIRSESNCLCK